MALAILGLLVGCSTPPLPGTAPAVRDAGSIASAAQPGRTPTPATNPAVAPQRERSRWIAAEWSELPGWGADRASEFWPALQRSCARPAPGWAETCAMAAMTEPGDDVSTALWLMQHLQPWRIESHAGESQGLLTGYYEPQLDATRRPQGAFRVPLHAAPADLARRRPWFSRQQIDSEAALQAQLRPLAYVEDPIDALVLQIQGSGRLRLQDETGTSRWVRLAFAGHNDLPYQSIGKQLVERGELKASEAGWNGIRDWLRRNPGRERELLWGNPRYVFFREEPISDPDLGPRGAQGVPLTPGRSIAVDPASIPYGTPVWLAATEPLSSTPLQRLVMAQDTGSAISGAVRADLFWGWGEQAALQAGRTRQPLRVWVLWPRTIQTLSSRAPS